MKNGIYTAGDVRKFLILFLPVFVLVVGGAVLFYRMETANRVNLRMNQEWVQCRIAAPAVDEKLNHIGHDLLFLSQQFVEHEPDAYLAEGLLQNLWCSVSAITKIYDQIRWIDAEGMERARVNYDTASPVVIPDDELQNKNDRYYFKESVGLGVGEIYVSPLDLNMEQGRVEIPRKPMIRFATPVFDWQGMRHGIVVLNYLAVDFLERLDRKSDPGRSLWLLNEEGYWLKGPEEADEWGFMFNRTDLTMTQQYPEAWTEISRNEQGQFVTSDGLWTFNTIQPAQMLGAGSSSKDQENEAAHDYVWKIVSFMPSALLHSDFSGLALRLTAGGIIILTAFVFGIFLLLNSDKRGQAYRLALEGKVFELDEKNDALRDAREAAENAARLKADFLASMSHEIRTPLNAIIGMTDILVQCQLDDEPRDCAEIIHTSGEALVQLINDILDFSKIESGKIMIETHDFDLFACVEGTVDLLRINAVNKGLELTCDIREDVPAFVRGDAFRLRQVLLNLLSNALKFTQDGEVDVVVECRPLDDRHELLFSVKDTGVGISPDQIENIFSAFTQADASTTREFGGSGLGLTISRNLAELMGGRIWVESIEGKGSSFYFTIQVESARQGHACQRKSIIVSENSRNILVVDDNATNRRIISAQLSRWGLNPVVFEFSRDALQSIVDGDDYAMMVCDMQMPTMDGEVLVGEIRKHRTSEELPIIILSTLVSELPDSMDVSDSLTKPVKVAELYDTVYHLLCMNQPRSAPPVAHVEPSVSISLRLLVVEDNRLNQMVMKRMLGKLDLIADFASDGVDALEMTAQSNYDLIFMDIQMPRMDGYSATRELVSRYGEHRDRPLIVGMSAHAMDEHRKRGLEAGMIDYITKPIQFIALQQLLVEMSRKIG